MGLTAQEMRELKLPYGNWECEWCGISEANLHKLARLVPKGKGVEEILLSGSEDFGKITEELADYFGDTQFGRFFGNPLNFDQNRKARGNFIPRNKSKLLALREMCSRNNDKRETVREFAKTFGNGKTSGDFWRIASEYGFVIGRYDRNNLFECEIAGRLPYLDNILLDAVISSPDLDFVGEADICANYLEAGEIKTAIFECKNQSPKKIVNNKDAIAARLNLIAEKVRPDHVILVTPEETSLHNSENFSTVTAMELAAISTLNQFKQILDDKTKAEEGNKPAAVIYGEDIAALRKGMGLTRAQMAALIGGNLNWLWRLENENRKLTPAYMDRLAAVCGPNDNKRNLLFCANRAISTRNERALKAKHTRRALRLSQKELANRIEIRPEFLAQYEHGLLNYPKLDGKIWRYLDHAYAENRDRIDNLVAEEIANWEFAESMGKVINLREKPTRGAALEDTVAKSFLDNGWRILRNAVLASEDGDFRKEIDIYANRKNAEVIVMCTEGRLYTSWITVAAELATLKLNFGQPTVLFVSPGLTTLGKRTLQKQGILAAMPWEVSSIIGELCEDDNRP